MGQIYPEKLLKVEKNSKIKKFQKLCICYITSLLDRQGIFFKVEQVISILTVCNTWGSSYYKKLSKIFKKTVYS